MLSNIAGWHPQIVHFAIALLFAGVAFRLVSLTGKLAFTRAAATTLILAGTVAAWLAVESGEKAHGPVERIPGVHEVLDEHEEWGERARNLFYIVALLELGTLAAARFGRPKVGRGAAFASALVGLVGLFAVYEAAEHGGEMVYEYGAGPGIRSGDPEHIERLLVAGLYNQAMQARKQENRAEAAHLIGELERLRPNEPAVKMLAIDSKLRDVPDPRGALAGLSALAPSDNPRQRIQRAIMRADAYDLLGMRDSARAVIEETLREHPNSQRLRAKADSLR